MRPAFLATLVFLAVVPLSGEPPRLVLQITVDQLRGDMIPRYREKFSACGFRRLIDHGIYFANAHFDSANTFTASGHAVLVTGADTAEHGMVANDWFDRDSGKVIYCTADPRHAVLGEPAKPGNGQSPVNLSSTTIGDELVRAGRGARAFAVGGKDRSAIIPGGHLGSAFWFSEKTGGFVSSSYYFERLPEWLENWNARRFAFEYRDRPWTALRDPASYLFQSTAGNPQARPEATLGRTFPHPLMVQADPLFLSAFRSTPFLDELTARFVRELVGREKIGQGVGTDYLSISFSATDYIGHAYGPDSMEAEDNLLRLDETLAGLLDFFEQIVGLDHVVIVLSADHGVDDIPEVARARGLAAGRIYPDRMKAGANTALREKFMVDSDLVAAFVPPGFYLDRAQLAAHHLDQTAIEEALAAYIRQQQGVAYALTRTDLLRGRLPNSGILHKVQRAFHPTRSGDVVVVQQQFWYMYPDPESSAAMHGSPYDYDTFVPIIFLGPGVKPALRHDAVSPAQIAPTLAAWLQIKAPSGCAAPMVLPGVLVPGESETK